MKKSMPGYFKISDVDIRSTIQEGVYVLDTNVLLSLYRFSPATANEFLKLFEMFKDRFWMPHQVSREFFANRLKVVEDQIRDHESFIKNQQDLVSQLKSDRHPFIGEATLKAFEKTVSKVVKDLEVSKNKLETLFGDDPYLERIADIFENRLGQKWSEKESEKYETEGKRRIEAKTPPGFEDKNKGGGREYGDYFIWQQVLEFSKAQSKDVVFVTEDTKKDWWQIIRGKTISPRPELLNEFKEVTNRKILVLGMENFLRELERESKKKVTKRSIEEVRAATAQSAEKWIGLNSLRDSFDIGAGTFASFVAAENALRHSVEQLKTPGIDIGAIAQAARAANQAIQASISPNVVSFMNQMRVQNELTKQAFIQSLSENPEAPLNPGKKDTEPS